MNPYDDLQPDERDGDLLRRIKDHAAVVDHALPSISGADVRRSVDATASAATTSGITSRGRAPFLAAAAAMAIVVGAGAVGLSRSSTSEPLEATPSTDATPAVVASEPDEVDDVVDEEVDVDDQVDEVEHEPAASPPDLMPRPVEAADFGAEEIRYLPSADSGFVVSTGSQVLLSEAELPPEAATPVRWQRVALPASDPSDRRSVIVRATTYADEAAANALIEAEPTSHGVAGEPMDVDGRLGAWHEAEGFAPFSAGNPMRVLGFARVRLDATTVLDIAAPDVSRAEVEQLIASISLAGDGSLELPTAPAGFDTPEPIEGLSPIETMNRPAASDYLSLTLAGVDGEQIDLSVSLEPAGSDRATAHVDTPTGYGWIEFGLFRETVVTFVGADATFVLANYDGQVSADELIAVAQSMELVDGQAWVERLAIAPLFKAPVSAVPIDD